MSYIHLHSVDEIEHFDDSDCKASSERFQSHANDRLTEVMDVQDIRLIHIVQDLLSKETGNGHHQVGEFYISHTSAHYSYKTARMTAELGGTMTRCAQRRMETTTPIMIILDCNSTSRIGL